MTASVLLRKWAPWIARWYTRRQGLRRFRKEFEVFRLKTENRPGGRLPLSWEERKPCLRDNIPRTPFDHHYLYHMAWAARCLAELKPARHVDVSSHLDFCATVSAFVPITHYELRPPAIDIDNFASSKGDLLSLPLENASVESLSCMHVIEHIGLGRYGDALDPDGDMRALQELSRVVAVQGSFLLVVPVGIPRVVFNAHRIYHPEHMITLLPGFDLREFALIPDDTDGRGLIRNAELQFASTQKYGCGCYWFVKKG